VSILCSRGAYKDSRQLHGDTVGRPTIRSRRRRRRLLRHRATASTILRQGSEPADAQERTFREWENGMEYFAGAAEFISCPEVAEQADVCNMRVVIVRVLCDALQQSCDCRSLRVFARYDVLHGKWPAVLGSVAEGRRAHADGVLDGQVRNSDALFPATNVHTCLPLNAARGLVRPARKFAQHIHRFQRHIRACTSKLNASGELTARHGL